MYEFCGEEVMFTCKYPSNGIPKVQTIVEGGSACTQGNVLTYCMYSKQCTRFVYLVCVGPGLKTL